MTLQVKTASLRAFKDSLNKMRDELNRDATRVLKHGLILLCISLRARTKKAPPKRPIRPTYLTSGRIARNQNKTIFFEYETYRSGKQEWKPMLAKNKTNAKKSDPIAIKYSGLAKKSWGWVMHELYKTNAGAPVKFGKPKGSVYTKKGNNGFKSFVWFSNKLGYIFSALDGGQSAVTDAFNAATKGIIYRIEEGLKKNGVKKT